MRRPRLGFLGVGWIGRSRLEAIAASGTAEIVAIADPSPDNLAAAQPCAPHAALVPSLEALLTYDLDGVVIATPSALHAEQALAALARGAAVFCQKPLARSAAETRTVIEAARQADRLIGVDLSYRHTAAVEAVRRVVQSGALGTIYAVNLVFHNAYGPDKAWFYDPKLSGGGCVIDLGVHLVDLALWLLDFPDVVSVSSRLFRQGAVLHGRETAVEDYALARLDLATGCTLQLTCSWNLPAGTDAVIEAACYGTAGGVAVRNVGGSFYDFQAERLNGTQRELLVAPPDAWGGRAAVRWAAQLAGSPRFDPQAEQLVAVAVALDAIYAAAQAAGNVS